MKDNYGREIYYLRVSVTQRCNLNCVYCGKDSCAKKESELSAEQIYKIVKAFAACGIKKVRITGGEPLLRKDICEIAAAVRKVPEISSLSLTTNGVLLSKYAQSLKDSGLDSINISLDTLNRETYKNMTGADALSSVTEGIQAAQDAGLSPVKINAVLINDINADEAEKLINVAKDNNIDVRFIELMPFSDSGAQKNKIVTGKSLLQAFPFLTPLPENSGTARYYSADGFKGKIGFIDPISHKFCHECSRIRLLCDGKVKPCLGYDTSYDVMPFINDENLLIENIKTIIKSKPAGHSFENDSPSHGLNKTGG
ncbi:MAG: GTP 3',8-cyclase MoaA [Clostridia bacterium]|nr:GTP 3',8-cyclase MoaA [Clostridia bacterium]